MSLDFHKRNASRRIPAAAAVLLGILATVSASMADPYPDRGGYNERDDVTGYLCVTPACDVLRHPTANCICIKENPGEYKLSRLKLNCLAKQAGQWVQCPVKQRYGN